MAFEGAELAACRAAGVMCSTVSRTLLDRCRRPEQEYSLARTCMAASMTLCRLGPSVSLISNSMLAPLGTALNTLGCTCQVPDVATLSLLPAQLCLRARAG